MFGLGVKTGIDLPSESVGQIGKNDNGGLLLARVDYIGDLITNINMPVKYVLYFSNEFKCKHICTDGWIDVLTLNTFEKHTKKLIEYFKKCLVEQRKDFLEKDFDND